MLSASLNKTFLSLSLSLSHIYIYERERERAREMLYLTTIYISLCACESYACMVDFNACYTKFVIESRTVGEAR